MSNNPLKYLICSWIVLWTVFVGDTAFPASPDDHRDMTIRTSGPSPSEESHVEPADMAEREPTGTISLGQVLALAILKNPGLASYSWEIRAAEARVLQAGLLPNPEFGFEAEELGWSDGRNGIGSAVMYFTVSQLFELGGKRGKRASVAGLERDMEGWTYASERLDLVAETTKTFIGALAAQKGMALSKRFYQLAKEVYETVSERAAAGKVSPLEKTKARVSLAGTRIEVERAERQWDAARKRLAATWGSASPEFEKVSGNLDTISELPSLDELLDKTVYNPDLGRWETEIRLNRAKLDLERSKRIPDVRVSAGLQRFEETDANAFVFGVSIPLPLFDRNQGGIDEAREHLRSAEEERRDVAVRIKTRLNGAYQDLRTAYFEAMTLEQEILPAAKEVFDGLSLGYRQGKFRYLDVLDAQRTLFEAQAKYIEALKNYHQARVAVERLAGQLEDNLVMAKGKREESHETK